MQGQTRPALPAPRWVTNTCGTALPRPHALASDTDLKPGMVIRIPGSAAAPGQQQYQPTPSRPMTRPGRGHAGDLSPCLPMLGCDEGCGEMGQASSPWWWRLR